MSGKLAIVFCVHHKPWLMMGTLLTFLSQEQRNADLFIVYNVGDGASPRESYREFDELAGRAQAQVQKHYALYQHLAAAHVAPRQPDPAPAGAAATPRVSLPAARRETNGNSNLS